MTPLEEDIHNPSDISMPLFLYRGLEPKSCKLGSRPRPSSGPTEPTKPRGHRREPSTQGVPQPAAPPGTQVRSPFGAGIRSSLVLLAPMLLAVELLMHHSEGGEEIAQEEEEEGEAAHEHLRG